MRRTQGWAPVNRGEFQVKEGWAPPTCSQDTAVLVLNRKLAAFGRQWEHPRSQNQWSRFGPAPPITSTRHLNLGSNVQVQRTYIKSLLLLSAVALLNGTVAARSAHNGSNQNPLVGAWKLVSLDQPGTDGQIHKLDCVGQFVFTGDGRASVQVMYQDAQAGSAYAQSGYEASYGSYRVNDASSFTFHVEGALVRTLIGKNLKRKFKIIGNHLMITSTDPNEHWKVIWERY